MKKMFSLIAIFVVIGLIGLAAFIAVMRWHNRSLGKERQKIALEEFSWAWELMLKNPADALLREHLKSRLYYYAGMLPDSILRGCDTLDYGPIDENLLGPYWAAPPRAGYPNDCYNSLMRRLKK
jgi:hypothetical protein